MGATSIEYAHQGLIRTGPLIEITLKLVFSIVSRMAFSSIRLSAAITLTSPLLTFTVASTTPGNVVSFFLSLRPQPGHSQPLMRTIHCCCSFFRGVAKAPKHTVVARPAIKNCRRSMFHLMASEQCGMIAAMGAEGIRTTALGTRRALKDTYHGRCVSAPCGASVPGREAR